MAACFARHRHRTRASPPLGSTGSSAQDYPDEAIPREIARLHDALEEARQRLLRVRLRAERHAGEEEAAIFEVQIAILADHELVSSVEALIKQNIGAEKAFDLILIEWRQNFARHAQPMIRERVGDLTDVQIRVLSVLLGLPDHDPVDVPKGTNAILVTHDLTPSLTVQLDREAIAGIATDAGTRTSHVAILARSLGLPAVVGLRDATHLLKAGNNIILDGSSGVIIVDPSRRRSPHMQPARRARPRIRLSSKGCLWPSQSLWTAFG